MTVIRMLVATVTSSLATEISLCAVIVYNHRLGRRKWCYNRSIKPAPGYKPYLSLVTFNPPSLPQTGYGIICPSNHIPHPDCNILTLLVTSLVLVKHPHLTLGAASFTLVTTSLILIATSSPRVN